MGSVIDKLLSLMRRRPSASPYASMQSRAFAAVIDLTLVVVPTMALTACINSLQIAQNSMIRSATGLAQLLALFAYSVIFLTRFGYTPGHALMAIRVVDAKTEQRVSAKVARRRTSVVVIAAIALWLPGLLSSQEMALQLLYASSALFLALSLWPMFDKKKRWINDALSGTVVINHQVPD